MRISQQSGRPDPSIATEGTLPARELTGRVGADDVGLTRARRGRWIAAGWLCGGLALFALLLRISVTGPMDSDAANNALQAWDMLHGHLLLHGWILGDATYYTLELPLYAITEVVFGVSGPTEHVVAALIFLIVVACAATLASANSRGPAVAARCGVVLAVLAAPLLTTRGVSILLLAPDHFGTSAIVLGSFLLIDRVPTRRFTAPLLGVILFAGQIGDVTVRYVAVPAILVVCAYRVLAARKILTNDAAIAIAAAASVPLSLLVRAVMRHFGAYSMVGKPGTFSPFEMWSPHAGLTLRAIRLLFGVTGSPGSAMGALATAFAAACLLAAVAGFFKVVLTWPTATRAEQLVCIAIPVNLAGYVVSTLPHPNNAREIVAVLPCGAVLAARVLVPARFVSAARAHVALALAALAAVAPLTAAATRPIKTPAAVPLAAWLRAHGLRYGLAGYWDASAVTVESGNQVQVRGVHVAHGGYAPGVWETKTDWYDPSRHDATFMIADRAHTWKGNNLLLDRIEDHFGQPATIRHVAGRTILIYRTNLLKWLVPNPPKPHVPNPHKPKAGERRGVHGG